MIITIASLKGGVGKTTTAIHIAGITFLGIQLPINAANLNAKVVSVGDGDTITVSAEGKNKTIRLACIDAPERSQTPWGQRSTAKLKGLLPPGQRVTIREATIDRYERIVGEVFVGQRSINLAMVESGEALVYRQYLDACSDTKTLYIQAEQRAKQQRIGYWNQNSPINPWDFRRKVNPPSAAASTSTGYISGSCAKLKAMGLSRFRVGDPNYTTKRDGDRDGIACE